MTALDDFAMIHTTDQWSRCAHTDTALDVELGVVQLAWQTEPAAEHDADEIPTSAGLAFDPWCRLYHALPEDGRVDRLRWDQRSQPESGVSLFREDDTERGDFHLADAGTGPLAEPRGLAVDARGRLFLAESGARRLLVYDLTDRRLLRSIPFGGSPFAVTTDGERVFVLVALDEAPWELWRLTARSDPQPVTLPDSVTEPGAVALAADGRLFVLDRCASPEARLVPVERPDEGTDAAFATGLAFVDDDVAVIARAPGSDFLRIRMQPGEQSLLPHLNARHYDGRGIAISPLGRVVYWTARGLATATLARVKYTPQGRIVSFRLDAQRFQTRWGRLFVDACVPQGSALKVHCLVADDVPDTPDVPLTPPSNAELFTIHRPDLSPPLPPAQLVNAVVPAQTLHRRSQGNEMPWQCPDDSGFVTYEAPVIAPPGRYLWLIIDLYGKSHATPKIRSVRAQYPDRDLLRRLPRVFSHNEHAADFLQRFLAMTDSGLTELDQLASFRHLLLDPWVTPVAVLPWLGSLLGMELDQRWSERARREILANAIWLFRNRGTVTGLKRFIEIYLGVEIVIVEHFKVRGLGGAFLGVDDDALAANSVLGAGFRIGGQIGIEETQDLGEISVQDAITTHAHRFSVIVPLSLDNEQRAVIEHILEVHRPAHTIFDLCSVDAGMRVGTGLHLELTTIVGLSSGFGQLQVGGSVIGRGDVLGRPQPGTSVGNSLLGASTRVG